MRHQTNRHEDGVDLSAGKRPLDYYASSKEPPRPDGQSERDSIVTGPLSFAQERLWILDQMQPGNPAYNIPLVLRLQGNLDLAALKSSLHEIARRHASLRTTFDAESGEPQQCVSAKAQWDVQITDLTETHPTERESSAWRIATAEIRRPFDLACAPLARAALLRLANVDHLLVITMHHIISDGWSAGVLMRELSFLYDSDVIGRSTMLAALPMQYIDFARQQRANRHAVEDAHLAYWEQQLAGAPPFLALSTDRPRPAAQTFHGAHLKFSVPASLTDSLKAMGRGEGATLFMTLVAAFQLLLHRYAGQTDVVIGSPIANRTRTELEGLIGFFANTLVLRGDLGGDPTIRELLRRTRRTSLDAFVHQDLPFESLVERLQPVRDLSINPIFQVMFVLQNAPWPVINLPGLAVSLIEIESEAAKFDLTLIMQEEDSGLRGRLEYNTDLFDAATIERFANHFHMVLERAVDDPDMRVSRLPFLLDAERQELIGPQNDTSMAYLPQRCFHRMFEQQAEQMPDSIAGICGPHTVSYKDLNARANRLARCLHDRGVGSDSIVAVLAERGLELVTAILAILKAGGAYLPLDPTHPPARLARALLQSGAPSVLVSKEFETLLACAIDEAALGADLRLLPLNELLREEHSAANLPVDGGPHDLAYVIYTSGSTGVPKGAMVEQQGMLNHLLAKVDALGLSKLDAVGQTASQCFDISVWQMLAPLLVGARLIVLSDEDISDPARLLAVSVREGITVLEVVPSLLRAILEDVALHSPASAVFPQLRWMIPTGEALPPDLCLEWFERFPHIPLLNAYGPTECSDDVAHWLISESPADDLVRVPIGRPIANMHLYVLDSNRELAPIGVVGELFVGGVGVGRGYLNDPERTAESFIPDPFARAQGARMYRTGDFARRLSNGVFEFWGRRDDQVKVRGFRIELGEIQVALASHPMVQDAVVLAPKDAERGTRLIAYVVPCEGACPGREELRRHLKIRLPDYMIPAAVIMLDAFPLTHNGKLDRKALPLVPVQTTLGGQSAEPHTPVEALLVDIWRQVLDAESISVHDNFFELGGDSIRAIQVVIRARRSGLQLTPRQFFQYQTIAELAVVGEQITDTNVVQTDSRLPLAELSQDMLDRIWRADPRMEDIYPLAPFQEHMFLTRIGSTDPGLYFGHQLMFFEGVEIDPVAFGGAWQQVANSHAIARTSFIWEGLDRPHQVVHRAVSLPVLFEDWRGEPRAEQIQRVEAYVTSERKLGFDYRSAPQWRLKLIRLADDAYCFIWCFNYMLQDGWTYSLIMKDAFACYEALCRGAHFEPERRRPYRDYLAWLRQQDLSKAASFWRQRLAGFTSPTSLVDRSPHVEPPEGEGYLNEYYSLPASITENLRELGKRYRLTLNTLLQGAWAILISHYCGDEDIVYQTVVSGRPTDLPGSENMIGNFHNLLPVRARVDGTAPLLQWLHLLQGHLVEMQQFEYSPPRKVKEWSDVPSELLLSESYIVFENFPVEPYVQDRLAAYGASVRGMTQTEHPLRLLIWPGRTLVPGPSLTLVVSYYRRCFHISTVRRVLKDYQSILQGMVSNPEASVGWLEQTLMP